MLTVIHLQNSRSDRVIWLLEEIGLGEHPGYSIETHLRDPETGRAGPSLTKLHPYAKAPMLRDGDTLLLESGAICEYVMEKYGDGGLRPASSDADWPDYLQWMHFAEGSAMLPILLDHFQAAGLAGPPGESPLAAMAQGGLRQLYGYVESVLAAREWLAGPRFTAADVMMGWVIEAVENRGETGPYPAMAAYVERIRTRPGHQRARARGAEIESAPKGE
jgi:glutathione S-transferase